MRDGRMARDNGTARTTKYKDSIGACMSWHKPCREADNLCDVMEWDK